jgi:hypothetical protein
MQSGQPQHPVCLGVHQGDSNLRIQGKHALLDAGEHGLAVLDEAANFEGLEAQGLAFTRRASSSEPTIPAAADSPR